MDVYVKMEFAAAHRLTGVLPAHKCARLHGHTWSVRVVVRGDQDPESGWVVDFGDVKTIVKSEAVDRLDHYYLNEIKGLENPTSEAVARWIWAKVRSRVEALREGVRLVEVEVSETCSSGAIYRGEA